MRKKKGKWVKTFPDEFFEALFKIRSLNWSLANKGQKPQYVRKNIDNVVYSQLAPKVLSGLRKLNSKDQNGKKKAKRTQYIDVDFGHPKLKEHLNILIELAKA